MSTVAILMQSYVGTVFKHEFRPPDATRRKHPFVALLLFVMERWFSKVYMDRAWIIDCDKFDMTSAVYVMRSPRCVC